MKRIMLALSAAFTISLAQAGPVPSASTATGGGEMPSAVRQFLSPAETGDPLAQLKLASMYFHGDGVRQDYTQALEWATKSVAQGNVEAMYLTGNILLYGPIDSEVAARDAAFWYAAAAGRGHVEAQYALGLLYFTGKGVQQDEEKAQRWFERAAGNGYSQARMFVAQKPTPCNY